MERVFIVAAKRTPIGKFGGTLAQNRSVDLGATVIQSVLQQGRLEANQIDQVLMGNVLQAGQGQNPARQAARQAGLPVTVPAITINDVCGSGLSSINLAASLIQSGQAQVVVAGGMESMSQAPYVLHQARFGYRMGDGQLKDTLLSDALVDANGGFHMGITAENVAKTDHISRAMMDQYALESHQKAVAAQAAGRFDDEIAPVKVMDAKGKVTQVQTDQAPRADTSLAKLAALKPVYQKDGTVTAGNASGINDGAAAVILVGESKLKELQLTPLAEWQAASLVGLAPELMGLGTYYAVEKLLDEQHLTIDQIDTFELNEAFAAQSLASMQRLQVDPSRVNRNGGALALGHPVGASGSRILVTLIYEMQRQHQKSGIASLCVGGGMGVAVLITR
ncbi:thiolase family protein [Weissella kandleri]|uniref:thiolase family protein n=1 Tax=Weissella kandleri TaxID=1616 RepID=UPI00387EA451